MRMTARKRTLTMPARVFLCLLMASVSIAMLVSCAKDVFNMFQLKDQISQNKTEISKLEDVKETLTDQKEKLQDPEYLKYMVRGKYLVTKDGEQVFKLPTSDKASEDNS